MCTWHIFSVKGILVWSRKPIMSGYESSCTWKLNGHPFNDNPKHKFLWKSSQGWGTCKCKVSQFGHDRQMLTSITRTVRLQLVNACTFWFCWPCIIIYQYSETVIHFLFNLLRIRGNIPSAACAASPEDKQVMLEICRGPWFLINWIKSPSRWFHYNGPVSLFKAEPNNTYR
jgi:hypothetical protein